LDLETSQVQLKRMEEKFFPLGCKLPYIIEYRTGINLHVTPHSCNFVIDSIFRNKEDMYRYQEREEHYGAIRRGSAIEKTKVVVDYEF